MPVLTREQWDKLPRELRIRWWEETKFDRLPPPDALLDAVMDALGQSGREQ